MPITHYSRDAGLTSACTMRRPARWSPIHYASMWRAVTCPECLTEQPEAYKARVGA